MDSSNDHKLAKMDNLGGFDPATMTYFSTQIAHPTTSGNDPFHDMMMPMEMPDHHSTYGYAGYARPLPNIGLLLT